jgi:polysaccharide biosynthesis protein VpsQ
LVIKIFIVFGRVCLTILPLIYMWLIWLQSSHFNPESIYTLSTSIDERILLLIGAMLELGHLFEFGILYFLLILMILSYGTLSKSKEWLCLIMALGYGIIDEIHQIYVPYRSFSVIDLLKDFFGVMAVWYIIHNSYFVKKSSFFGRNLKTFTAFLNK